MRYVQRDEDLDDLEKLSRTYAHWSFGQDIHKQEELIGGRHDPAPQVPPPTAGPNPPMPPILPQNWFLEDPLDIEILPDPPSKYRKVPRIPQPHSPMVRGS
jgi:hypothetical protein